MDKKHFQSLIRCKDAIKTLLDNRALLELSEQELNVIELLSISIVEDIENITNELIVM